MAGRRTRNLVAIWDEKIMHDRAPSNPPTPPPPECSESSPEGMSMAFRALQFLPIPLLVLSDQKTIVLANTAMGEYLGLEVRQNNSRMSGDYRSNGVTEMLYGKTLNYLGFDGFGEDASLCMISWEFFLDSLVRDIGQEGKLKDTNVYVHVPTTKTKPTWRSGKCGPVRRTQMTISPWRGSDGDMYYTCTLKTVAWKRAIPILECPMECPGFGGIKPEDVELSSSSSSSETDDDGDESVAPREPAGLTVAEKMAVLKEALIDVSEVPVFALWHDASVASTNRAGFELIHPLDEESVECPEPFDRMQALKNLKAYLPDFSRELSMQESPLIKIVTTRKPLDSMIVGMYTGGKKRVVDVTGKCIYDINGGFVGALVAMRDVTKITEMQQTLDTEAQRNEERFRNILDCIPQMIWTTTAIGEHDYFSKRWYDYTGMVPEKCIGSVKAPSHPVTFSTLTNQRQGWMAAYHQDDATAIKNAWALSISTGQDYSVEYRCRRHDGAFRWMLGRALPLKDPKTGEIIKWYGTSTDIHDMVAARTAERATRRQLDETLTHAKLTLWATDQNGVVNMLEGILGGYFHDYRDVVGRHINDVLRELDPENKYGGADPIGPLLRGEITEALGQQVVHGRHFQTRYVSVRGRKGPGGGFDPNYVAGVIGISMDVSRQWATEQRLREREAQNAKLMADEAAAREASKLKSEFLASMSHEIRTPIAGVVGMCEILLMDPKLTPEQRELGDSIQRSANALLTVINDILDLSKVESGMIDIEEVPFNLSVVIWDVVRMLSFEAGRKKLHFEHAIDFHGVENLTVLGDPGRVRQILTNLLSNAVKFTHEGAVELKASVVKEEEEAITIHFTVKDTGIGISHSDQSKLFQPFTQADSTTARRFGGTGLGLTICKNLVNLMGGEIGLESSAGEGTSAHFTIPFRKPQRGECKLNIEALPERLQSDMSVQSCKSSTHGGSGTETRMPSESDYTCVPEPTPGPNNSLLQHLGQSFAVEKETLAIPEERRKRHVLVVEDNEVNQQIAIRLIKKLNFTVSAVKNGLECLEFIKKSASLPPSYDESSDNPPSLRKPDIILMDVQMPEMDGYSATRAIRSGKLSTPSAPTQNLEPPEATEWLGTVPIVAMTASAIKGDREKCRDAGMDDYLSKPVRGGMLEKMLVKWCSNSSDRGAGSSPGSRATTPGGDSTGDSPPEIDWRGDGSEGVRKAMNGMSELKRNMDGVKKGTAENAPASWRREKGANKGDNDESTVEVSTVEVE
ncbi:hypothetical protein FN846DRAFT_912437 [Sphaerosporella brunnea]|uniref:Uncharacterized protein n=1 Tax=Sphaerosporella brunnea TaxID=1250544 RepID=A0A5J5EIE5_9PEZI|nr:hypothetical protein FN846DRAFT_912437 [Sphaerosporella brunnea]